MKYSYILILILFSYCVYAQDSPLNRRVFVAYTQEKIVDVLKQIESKAGCYFYIVRVYSI
jgi:hypothetical protein